LRGRRHHPLATDFCPTTSPISDDTTRMSTSNRTALLTKTHKVLKKHYKPHAPKSDRTALEHLLYGCCLENSPPEAADKTFSTLVDQFFDWNEVRVSTVRELTDVMPQLNDSEAAAVRVKGCLQSVFESLYAFDLEFLRKQNLGQAIKTLQKYHGTTPFVVAYVTQAALGGHSIPVNQGGFQALEIVGAITPAEAAKQTVPGLERAILKTKGVEFGSLLHQLGVDLAANPHSPTVRKVLLEIEPECKDRLPKRGGKKKSDSQEEAAAEAAAGNDGKNKKRPETKKKDKKPPTAKKKPAPTKKTSKKRPATAAAGKKAGPTKKKTGTKRLARRKPR
jgi:endonuclease-3